LDPRRVYAVQAELSGAGYAEQARQRIEEALRASGAREEDLVFLRLVGRRASGLDLDFLEELTPRYFHLRVDLSGIPPDLDLSRYPSFEDARTTEERFVARLRQLAESEEPEESELACRALLYGLDALRRARLDTRYES